VEHSCEIQRKAFSDCSSTICYLVTVLMALAIMPKCSFAYHSQALTNIAIWLGALPTVMNPRNDLATTGGGFITNANLYTFAWAGFFAAVAVLASYMKVAGYSKDNSGARNKSFSPVGWAALAACSCIAMAAAIHLYRDRKCDESNPVFDDVFVLENHSAYCNRTEFAFSLGVISGCIAAVWAFLGSRFPVIFDSLLSFVMLAAWVCGLAYITFGGNKAPGNIVGNMLFFTLGAISIAIYIAISGFQNMLDEMGFGGSTTDATPEPTPEEPTQGEGEAAEGEDPTQGDGEAAEEEAVEV
jgi:hypothetical protein